MTDTEVAVTEPVSRSAPSVPGEVELVRTISLPDWGGLDTVLRRSKPFALWPVGELPLLYHWLDDSVDRGVTRLRILVADRPAEVRRAMEEATMWPISWEVVPVPSLVAADPEEVVDHLPGGAPPDPVPGDGWDLITYWHRLELAWLEGFTAGTCGLPAELALGPRCSVHPSVKLIPPYWIGEEVMIGPEAEIGPGVVVGSGSLLAGGNRLRNCHVASGSYLGPNTLLEDAMIDGGILVNWRNRARVEGLETFLLGTTVERGAGKGAKPGIRERWNALRLRQKWLADPIDWKRQRCPLLKEVSEGRRRLFGVLPGTLRVMDTLPREWAEALGAATPGALSLSDLRGADPASEEAALHTVFMLADPTGTTERFCRTWVREERRR